MNSLLIMQSILNVMFQQLILPKWSIIALSFTMYSCLVLIQLLKSDTTRLRLIIFSMERNWRG